MAKWTESSVGQLCDAGLAELQTGPFGTQLHAHDYVDEGIPVVPTEAIRARQIDRSVLPKITPSKAQELERHTLKAGDILFARRGAQATGHVAYVRDGEAGFICGTGAIRLRVAETNTKVSAEFLSHVFADPTSIQWFKFHAIGATMPNLNEGIIRAFALTLPPVSEQIAIANLLSALDDKIQLNVEMNETLELVAQAVFRDWFVEFGPTKAKSDGRPPYLAQDIWQLFPDALDEEGKPNGWLTGDISDVATHVKGSISPSAHPDELFEHYSIPAYDAGQVPSLDRGATILSNKTPVPPEAILLSKLNPDTPRVWLIPEGTTRRAICSTEFLVFHPNEHIGRAFVYHLFCSMPFLETLASRVTGTSKSHQRVKPDSILTIECPLPTNDILRAFDELAWPLLLRVLSNRDEIQILANLRDLLLPKLLTGEITLRNAEKAVERVA